MYKQYATTTRMGRIVGDDGELGLFYWDNTNITSDDVMLDTKSELGESIAQRRSMIFDLLNAGLLQDENGKLSNAMRLKVLQMLGFGVWEDALDNNSLQIESAKRENIAVVNNEKIEVLEIHDHDLHISAHTAFMLSGDFEKVCKENTKVKEKMLEHIREHKQFKKLTIIAENTMEVE